MEPRTDTPQHDPSRVSAFARLAGWAIRGRWAGIAIWIAVLAVVTVASQAVGGAYRNDFALPGTESQQVADTLAARAPGQAGDTIEVALQAPAGVRTPAIQSRVRALLADLRPLAHVARVEGPYRARDAISRDGTIARVTVTLDAQAQDVPTTAVKRIITVAQRAGGHGLRVELAGAAVQAAESSGGGAAEGAGLLAALVILVLLFGSVVAASLPIVMAIFAVGATLGLIALASHAATIADFTPPLMTLVGLGVGIDYALLIFSRYRSELLDGAPRDAAVRTALDSAGRTVLFAGCTAIVALLGLVVLGLGALQGVAVAVALTVLVTMIAALTLLPALLALLGPRLERSARRHAERGRRPEGTRWRRWSELVQRWPWPSALVAVAALLALAAPALGMRLGFADASSDPPDTTTRQAYDLLARGFGPGFNGPLVLVAEDATPHARQMLHERLAHMPDIADVAPPRPLRAGGELEIQIVYPASAPQSAATQQLVGQLRTEVLPPLERRTGTTVLVGGPTAAAIDFADTVSDRLPWFIAVVVGVSALLLALVFRSLLIPLKAAALNVLTVGVALGAMTLVFQDGALAAQPGPIEAYLPVMVFAIVFGLSMDYEVFLVGRMHEEWRRRHEATLAIREGLATTGRVVSAAAAIMVVVFASFLLSADRMLQQFGFGLAVAIFVDALVIRCLVVPAVMQLLGRRAWWLPAPMAKWLPRLPLEAPQRPRRTTTPHT